MTRNNIFTRIHASTGTRSSLMGPALLLGVLSVSLFLAGHSRGEDGETVKCPYMEQRAACMRDLAGTLELTEEQAVRLEEIREEHREELVRLRHTLHARMASLDEIFRDPYASEERILASQEELASIKEEMREKTIKARLQARSILSEDQIRALPPGHSLGVGRTGGPCPHAGKACTACPRDSRPCGPWHGKHPL